MNIVELAEKLRSGDVKLVTNGHRWARFNMTTFEAVLEQVEDKIGFYQEQFAASVPGETPNMYEFYRRHLNNEICIGDVIWDLFEGPCFSCSARLKLVMTSDTEVQLTTLTLFGIREKLKINYSPCVFARGRDTIVTNINVTSDLYFVNHFGTFPETPDEAEWHDGYSVNYHIGRLNIAKYLAHKNIGFGQVGNTSVEIYLRKDKKAIWIAEHADLTRESIADDLDRGITVTPEQIQLYEMLTKRFSEYECQGSISLGCWRWMCADAATITENNLKLNNQYIISDVYKADNKLHNDIVQCPVVHGQWRIKHYDNTDKHKFDGVTIATLELCEPASVCIPLIPVDSELDARIDEYFAAQPNKSSITIYKNKRNKE